MYAQHATIHGTMLFGAPPLIPLDFQIILIARAGSKTPGMWTRSPATHNKWRAVTRSNLPSRNIDLVTYLCPTMFLSAYGTSATRTLVNLGPTSVRGTPAWHLQTRTAPTSGGFKGTVQQLDFYLARSSGGWLRFTSLYRDPTFSQRVSIDFTRLASPPSIIAPKIGSSSP